MIRLKPFVLAILTVSASLTGCAKDEGTTLDRDAFYRPPAGTNSQRHVLQDQPGQLNYDNVRVDLLAPQPDVQVLGVGEDDGPPRESVTSVSDAVRQSVQLPTSSGDGRPAAGPATAPTAAHGNIGVPAGVSMIVGAVVCEVNGAPIYADKVLASLTKAFSTEARQRDERAFRRYAKEEIERQVTLFVEAELAFAAAKKNLDPREQDLATALTMQWRARQITEAGGSIEQARAKAAAEGYSFDERVDEEFRTKMVWVYYQKRLIPRAQVRADDMRRYYNQHQKQLFTEHDQARFRMIKIDATKTGGADQAAEKIANLRDRAARGEDFEQIAKAVNDDPNLMRRGGDVGWVQRGAFALDDVEAAVWKLQPGQVSNVVRVGDAFYVAKLEERKVGRVRPFEEEAVQKQIRDALLAEMLSALRSREREALLGDAIVYPYPPATDVVLDMAMQKYPAWAAAN